MTRWIEFISEFNEIDANATLVEEVDWEGNLQTFADYNVEDIDVWKSFKAKWCIPFSSNYNSILRWTSKYPLVFGGY